VSPRLPPHYLLDGVLSYTILARECQGRTSLRRMALETSDMSGRVPGTNISDIGLRELMSGGMFSPGAADSLPGPAGFTSTLPSRVGGPFSGSSFLGGVFVVVGGRAEKQMVGVHAGRLIAPVENRKTSRYRAPGENPRRPMGAPFPGPEERAVAILVASPGPPPTSSSRARAYLGSPSIDRRNRGSSKPLHGKATLTPVADARNAGVA
jgi:hypothetical protein